MNKTPKYSGEPDTKWCTDENSPDRDMELLDEFYFIDPNGKQWHAAKGEIVDGASIPRFLWALVGSPYTRDYRRASIVHDIAVRGLDDTPERKEADIMFYHACREGGCSIFESWVLYLGVRIGSWTSGEDEDYEDDYDEYEVLARNPKKISASKQAIRDEFEQMVYNFRDYDDSTSFEIIDQLIENLHNKFIKQGLV